MREIEEEYGVKEGRDVTNIKILKETVAKLGAEGEVLKEENLELRERVKRLEKSTKVIA
jgi:cell division protein FtsB